MYFILNLLQPIIRLDLASFTENLEGGMGVFLQTYYKLKLAGVFFSNKNMLNTRKAKKKIEKFIIWNTMMINQKGFQGRTKKLSKIYSMTKVTPL